MSQWLANPAHPSLATRQNWLVDQLFDLLPDAVHVTVNPGFVGEAVGRRVRYVDMPPWMFLGALRVMGARAGIDIAQMAEVRWYYEESALGTWERGAPTSHVQELTGARPEDFLTHRPPLRHTTGGPTHLRQPRPRPVGPHPHRPHADTAAGPLRPPPAPAHARHPETLRTLPCLDSRARRRSAGGSACQGRAAGSPVRRGAFERQRGLRVSRSAAGGPVRCVDERAAPCGPPPDGRQYRVRSVKSWRDAVHRPETPDKS